MLQGHRVGDAGSRTERENEERETAKMPSPLPQHHSRRVAPDKRQESRLRLSPRLSPRHSLRHSLSRARRSDALASKKPSPQKTLASASSHAEAEDEPRCVGRGGECYVISAHVIDQPAEVALGVGVGQLAVAVCVQLAHRVRLDLGIAAGGVPVGRVMGGMDGWGGGERRGSVKSSTVATALRAPRWVL